MNNDDQRCRKALRRHSRRRAEARWNTKLTRNLRAMLIHRMLSGQARFLGTGHTAYRTRWELIIGGHLRRFVYDEKARELVTVY
ncbi:MAG TPA: hypothetical protein VH475_01020 [Tepidisphaeraceae bacterium]|jgi:hypothetical protein